MVITAFEQTECREIAAYVTPLLLRYIGGQLNSATSTHDQREHHYFPPFWY